MSSGLLSIGASGLDAAYAALRTTGNNIANVSTPGYTRETANVSAQVQTGVGGLYVGNGVQVDSITRVYSDFLAQQTNLAQAQASQADTAATLTGQVNNLFSSTTAGIGNAINAFLNQVQTVANQPGSASARQALLSTAQQMTGQFNDISGQLQLMTQNTDAQLAQQVKTVNTTVADIAQLNDQISIAQATGGSPNSLLDQRDQDIATLNQSVGVTTLTQSDGSINVFLSNGQPLLVGDKPNALAVGPDPVNSQGVVVGTTSGSTIIPIDPNASGGGAIGALLQFRSSVLPQVQDELGRVAVVLSSKINALQANGVDANGATGTNFFSVPAATTVSASTNPDAATVSVGATITNASQLQASDYRLQVNGPASYTLTRLSDNTTTNLTSLPANVDGMTLQFSGGTPATGDIFTIEPVRAGAANIQVALTQGSQIAAASPLVATPAAGNQGSLAVSGLTLTPLTGNGTPNAALNSQVVVNFTTNPMQYTTVTYTAGIPGPTSAAQTYTPGQTISVNGWSLTLTGSPANGDSITVQPGSVGSGDNRNALLMSQLQGLNIVGQGSTGSGGATLGGAVGNLVSDVGSIAAQAQTEQTSNDAILQQAQGAQSSLSGVNLDEEASKLLQYQQQYQAAAKVIQIADTVFNSILQAASAA